MNKPVGLVVPIPDAPTAGSSSEHDGTPPKDCRPQSRQRKGAPKEHRRGMNEDTTPAGAGCAWPFGRQFPPRNLSRSPFPGAGPPTYVRCRVLFDTVSFFFAVDLRSGLGSHFSATAFATVSSKSCSASIRISPCAGAWVGGSPSD